MNYSLVGSHRYGLHGIVDSKQEDDAVPGGLAGGIGFEGRFQAWVGFD